jgi:glutamyl/glutaminyl-tRNA synthetase
MLGLQKSLSSLKHYNQLTCKTRLHMHTYLHRSLKSGTYLTSRHPKPKKVEHVETTADMVKRAKKSEKDYEYYSDDQSAPGIKQVRVRYAPSPTGAMHIGGLRTALFNYLFAKVNDGKFILRIEDTDKSREVMGSDHDIAKVLKWAGLTWDEGLGSKFHNNSGDGSMGPYGPYYQSQRLGLYRKYVDTLVENEHAYH